MKYTLLSICSVLFFSLHSAERSDTPYLQKKQKYSRAKSSSASLFQFLTDSDVRNIEVDFLGHRKSADHLLLSPVDYYLRVIDEKKRETESEGYVSPLYVKEIKQSVSALEAFDLSLDHKKGADIVVFKNNFLLSKRVNDWFKNPKEALKEQGYYDDKNHEKKQLIKDLGEEMVIMNHSFPRIIDGFTDLGNLRQAKSTPNILLFGEIRLLNKEKEQTSFFGSYTWAPDKKKELDQILAAKLRKKSDSSDSEEGQDQKIYTYWHHRTFLVDSGFLGECKEKSFSRLSPEERYIRKCYKNKDSNDKKVKLILVDSIDFSVAFVTSTVVYVVSPNFKDTVFIVYLPSDQQSMGLKKYQHMKKDFDPSGRLSADVFVLWNSKKRSEESPVAFDESKKIQKPQVQKPQVQKPHPVSPRHTKEYTAKSLSPRSSKPKGADLNKSFESVFEDVGSDSGGLLDWDDDDFEPELPLSKKSEVD